MQTRIENIPAELKAVKQWVCWVGADKIPRNPYNGFNAKSNDATTWGDFETAVQACEDYGFDGVGFMFAPPYFGVDLDHCLDNVDFCDEFVETLQSYAEISKSGSGLHIICKGKLPNGARRKGGVEMYSQGRYFICTGNLYDERYKTINDCTESIKILRSKYLPETAPTTNYQRYEIIDMTDQEVIDKATNCKTGYMFTMLYHGNWQGVYPSQSEADLALCNQLAFWTQKNEVQMDRLFRASGLMREKWNRKISGSTYGQITIGKAIENCMNVYSPNKDNDTDLALAIFGDGKIAVERPKKKYDLNDTGNARRMFDRFGDIIRYSYSYKRWFYWNGKKWCSDDGDEIKKMADVICDEMKREAFQEEDENQQTELLRWANRTASSKGKEAMIRECQHLENIPSNPEDFDAYADYLNCQNGVINLRNGELLPHDSKFMMSKICYTEYDTSGQKPVKWLKFLDDVTSGDKELQEYIQKCVGYSLSGSIREQCAYFLYGLGNNGKSTFLDTISDMLGDYANNAQPETIMMKRFGDTGAGSDIARLKSARFVTSEEPTEGVRLNEGLLKQLTGGSKVTCRFLYCDEFEYTPEFKIWIATNHKPVIRGMDAGIWRRIKLIPFEVNIPQSKVDKMMKYRLRKEFPQILRWAVEGCIKWQSEGMNEPEKIQLAVKDYKREMDLLASFMEQCVEIDYNCEDTISASDLFQTYLQWAKHNNEFEMSANKFGREISKKVPERIRTAAGIVYKYIRFTDYAMTFTTQKTFTFADFR